MSDRLPKPPREICIVMMTAIGDAVHVLPVVNALKRAYPDCRITWIIQPLPHKLVHNHPAVDEFVIFRRRRGFGMFRSFREIRQTLSEKHFDLIIALQVYFKAGIVTSFARGSVKLGFDMKRARDMNWLFTNARIPKHPVQHVQDQYIEFLIHLGVDPNPVTWGITITEEERQEQRRFFEQADRPTCAIVVGTSKVEKNWSPSNYARLMEILEERFGFQTILIGGPSAVERTAADEILATTKATAIDTLGNDLRRVVYLLDGSDLVISSDTGPLHIARALDVPVVGLYGYTNPKRSGPYRKYTDLVCDGYARKPDEDYPASIERRSDGMSRVTLDMAVGKVALAVERYCGPKSGQSH